MKTETLQNPVRPACAGKPAGPSLYHLLAVLGKDKVMQRIEKALAGFGG